jgi:SET domain-containing protein
MGLIVRSSLIHAAGVYTTEPIEKGTHIVEYDGPRVNKQQAEEIYGGRDVTYLYGIGDGEVIINGNNIAAFINHSCDPNCESDEIGDRVFIIAIRDIEAGEELIYDYCLYDGEADDPAICHCGAKQCRGSMYNEDEIKRLKNLGMVLPEPVSV